MLLGAEGGRRIADRSCSLQFPYDLDVTTFRNRVSGWLDCPRMEYSFNAWKSGITNSTILSSPTSQVASLSGLVAQVSWSLDTARCPSSRFLCSISKS
jgi:hypothetical protein